MKRGLWFVLPILLITGLGSSVFAEDDHVPTNLSLRYAHQMIKDFNCSVLQLKSSTSGIKPLGATELSTVRSIPLSPTKVDLHKDGVVSVDVEEWAPFWIEAKRYGNDLEIRVRYGEQMAIQAINLIKPLNQTQYFRLGVYEGGSYGDYYFLQCRTKGGDPGPKGG